MLYSPPMHVSSTRHRTKENGWDTGAVIRRKDRVLLIFLIPLTCATSAGNDPRFRTQGSLHPHHEDRQYQCHMFITFKEGGVSLVIRRWPIGQCCLGLPQAWHGNLSCAKALVGGGARLSQRNKSGFTAREGLLKAGATFSRGRRPKVIRAILKYLECAEVSAEKTRCYSSLRQSHISGLGIMLEQQCYLLTTSHQVSSMIAIIAPHALVV